MRWTMWWLAALVACGSEGRLNGDGDPALGGTTTPGGGHHGGGDTGTGDWTPGTDPTPTWDTTDTGWTWTTTTGAGTGTGSGGTGSGGTGSGGTTTTPEGGTGSGGTGSGGTGTGSGGTGTGSGTGSGGTGSGTGTGTGGIDTGLTDDEICLNARGLAGYLDAWQTAGDGRVYYCHSLNGTHYNFIESDISSCLPHLNHRYDVFPSTGCDS